jgi:hypothetical protein
MPNVPTYAHRRKFILRYTEEHQNRIELILETDDPEQHACGGTSWTFDQVICADELMPVTIDHETGAMTGLLTNRYKMPTTYRPGYNNLSGEWLCQPCCNGRPPTRMVVPLLRIIDQVGQVIHIRLSGSVPRAGKWNGSGPGIDDVALRFSSVDVYSDQLEIYQSFWGHDVSEPNPYCQLRPIPESTRDLWIPVRYCDQVIDMWEWSPGDDFPDCTDGYQRWWWQGQPWNPVASEHRGYSLTITAELVHEGFTGASLDHPQLPADDVFKMPGPGLGSGGGNWRPGAGHVIDTIDIPRGVTTEQLRAWFWSDEGMRVRSLDRSGPSPPEIVDPLKIALPGEPERFVPGKPSRGCGPNRSSDAQPPSLPVPGECLGCSAFTTLDYGWPACRQILKTDTACPCNLRWADAVQGRGPLPEDCSLRRKRDAC